MFYDLTGDWSTSDHYQIFFQPLDVTWQTFRFRNLRSINWCGCDQGLSKALFIHINFLNDVVPLTTKQIIKGSQMFSSGSNITNIVEFIPQYPRNDAVQHNFDTIIRKSWQQEILMFRFMSLQRKKKNSTVNLVDNLL